MNNIIEQKKQRYYPALNIVSIIFKIMAFLFIIAGIVISIYYLANINDDILPVIGFIFAGLWIALWFFAIAELIKVMVNISADIFNVYKQISNNNIIDTQERK